ncbi:hypothetical protein LTR84_006616 [Exophiala bonariae]|uniref:Zinc finger PHD-type domain-containing protein n=1 Tax=Exophiala bonariae TaxID=1690606 RepID=A0AAV9N0L9_9EURO|nr:hypothetical protein LTR84_006616 [Exophiala bonariae]
MWPKELHTSWSGGLYFDRNACLSSWTGIVDDELSISEGSIRDFIRGTNRGLYEKLRGLPYPTYSLKCDRTVIRECEDQDPAEVQVSGKLRLITTESGELGVPPSPLVQEFRTISSLDTDTVLTVIDSIVLGAFTFTLHHHDGDRTVCCLHPTCLLPHHIIPKGYTFAGVRCNNLQNADHPWSSVDFYCADCLDVVVKLHVDTMLKLDAEKPELVDSLYDGTPKAHILQAAERLQPELIDKNLWKMYYPTEPPLEVGVGSNSPKGLRLRRQKQYEIKQILKKVILDRYAEQIGKQDTTEPGSLVIVRPRHLPPYAERYKKQGRERTQDRGARQKLDSVCAIIDEPIPERGVSCWCGEPNVEREMIQCSSEYCMFGLIHFECTNLKEIPIDDGKFLCRYCQTDPLIDGKMPERAETPLEDDLSAIVPSMETDNDGDWDTEVTSSEQEQEQDEDGDDGDDEYEEDEESQDGEHELDDEHFHAASRFVTVNNQLEPWMALPEMKWSVSDEDMGF